MGKPIRDTYGPDTIAAQAAQAADSALVLPTLLPSTSICPNSRPREFAAVLATLRCFRGFRLVERTGTEIASTLGAACWTLNFQDWQSPMNVLPMAKIKHMSHLVALPPQGSSLDLLLLVNFSSYVLS